MEQIIFEELNVKSVGMNILQAKLRTDEQVVLDTAITPQLKLEGQAREIVRFIQEMRKEAGYEVENHISVQFEGMDEVFEKFSDLIAKETLADSIEKGAGEGFDLKKELEVDGMRVAIAIKK